MMNLLEWLGFNAAYRLTDRVGILQQLSLLL